MRLVRFSGLLTMGLPYANFHLTSGKRLGKNGKGPVARAVGLHVFVDNEWSNLHAVAHDPAGTAGSTLKKLISTRTTLTNGCQTIAQTLTSSSICLSSVRSLGEILHMHATCTALMKTGITSCGHHRHTLHLLMSNIFC